MATERITFDFPGLLTVDQTSQQARATYKRTLTKVRLSTLGVASAATDIKVQLRLANVAQATEYTLPAGLKSAENTAASVEVAANTWHDFIITATGSAVDLKVEAEFEVAVTVTGGSTLDLGLGTLGQLKRFIIGADATSTTYDEAITLIGRGAAGLIDRHCNRTFKRSAAAVEDFRGGAEVLVLARYPLEAITSIGLKAAGESAFTTQSGVVDTYAVESGVLLLSSAVGTHQDQLRVTYAGGYWYDTTDDESGTMPTGATLLPYDITAAWLLQCQQIWQSRDDIGIAHVTTGGDGALLNTRLGVLKIIPQAEDILEPYRRMML